MTNALLLALAGRELASMVFVRDYLQLEFDGPRLSVFVWPQITRDHQTQSIGDPGYRDSLCSLIGRPVHAAAEDPEIGLAIHFKPGSVVIKPQPADVEGPEIALLTADAGNADWMV